ncbi:MAG: acyl-CoA dehydrogenase family protein, partial [Mycobacterium sp.]
MSSKDLAVDLKARVQALLDEHDPATTDPREFLGAQYDAGLAWVHLPHGVG